MNTQDIINTFSLTKVEAAPEEDFILSTAEYGVHILPDSIYKLRYKGNTRAICQEKTGHIFIRESAYSHYVLVHELVHRLSRTQKRGFLGRKYWQNGIASIENGINYTGLNEIITEWFAVKISGWELGEGNANLYQSYFPIFQKIFHAHERDIASNYFQGNAHAIYEILESKQTLLLTNAKDGKNILSSDIKSLLNSISENIIHREYLQTNSQKA